MEMERIKRRGVGWDAEEYDERTRTKILGG
jgi:hypothetical protein